MIQPFHNINVNPSYAQLNDAMYHEQRHGRQNQEDMEMRAIEQKEPTCKTCKKPERIIGTLDINGECWSCWWKRIKDNL